jgi:hypothetical protein
MGVDGKGRKKSKIFLGLHLYVDIQGIGFALTSIPISYEIETEVK